jgi:competence protein ComEC
VRITRTSIALAAVAGFVVLWNGAFRAQGSVTTPGAGQMNAHFIDVGQGASILLEFACGAALIDTGGEKNDQFDSTSRLQDYLDDFFQRRADLKSQLAMVVISHAHIDHTRGLPMLLGRYGVSLLVDNGIETGSGGRQQKAAHARARESRGQLKWQPVSQPALSRPNRRTPPTGTLACARQAPQFTFLWGALDARDGWPNEILNNGNDSSVVTRLDFGQTSFLFPGDLEDDVQEELIDENCPNGIGPGCPLDVDIYHVSHHGSHNGTSGELMTAMTPRLAIISMGPWDRRRVFTAQAHGHPRKSTLDVLLGTDGVQDSRTEKTVMVARRSASAKTPTGAQFAKTPMTRAVYATGWDDTVVIAARANETWRVITSQ